MATSSQQLKSEKLRIFSERFKSALRRSNFQDNEIAEKMGVAPSAISNWRQGLNMAKGKNLRRLAEVLNCRPGWLLGEEGDVYTSVQDKGRRSHMTDTWHDRALAAEKNWRTFGAVSGICWKRVATCLFKKDGQPVRLQLLARQRP
jgi:transcriptional regulator with XRE-family HTH domain